MSKDNGGPAFPSNENKDSCKFAHHEGMSLRDYLAAKAMQQFAKPFMYNIVTGDTAEGDALVAKRSYQLADAMLAERNK